MPSTPGDTDDYNDDMSISLTEKYLGSNGNTAANLPKMTKKRQWLVDWYDEEDDLQCALSDWLELLRRTYTIYRWKNTPRDSSRKP